MNAVVPGPGEIETWAAADEATVRPTRAPQQLTDLLDRFTRARGWRERLEGAVVFRRWHDIVGPELARRCEPVRLAGGRLLVRAESAVWATEVSYLVGRIVLRADEVLRPGLVREVQVTVGPLQGLAGPQEPISGRSPPA